MTRHRRQGPTDRPTPTESAGWRETYRFLDCPLPDSTDKMQDRECHFCDWIGPKNRYPAHLGEGECPGPERRESDGERELVADGGFAVPAPGDIVRDRDGGADPPVYLLVLETFPRTPAKSWVIDSEDATVAELNPGYDPEAPVVRAVYVEALGQYLEDPNDLDAARSLVDRTQVYPYDFPAPRLEADSETSTSDPDGPVDAGGERA